MGFELFTVAVTQAVPAGRATIRFEFADDGSGLAKGGHAAHGFSLDDAADVGTDWGAPLTVEFMCSDSAFTRRILKVTVGAKEMGAGVKAHAAEASSDAAKKMAEAK